MMIAEVGLPPGAEVDRSALSAVLDGQPEALGALAQVPEAMSQTLTMNEAIAQAAPRYRYMEGCVVIGRLLS